MSVFSPASSGDPFFEGSIAHCFVRLAHLAGHANGPEAQEHVGALARALPRAFEGELSRAREPPPVWELSRALLRLRAVKRPCDRARRYLGLVDAALAAGCLADARALLDHAPSTRARHRATLALALCLGERGERTAARRLLGAIGDPALSTAVALARARLDLDGGHPRRAAARLAALPASIGLLPRARLARGARSVGEVDSLEVQCAREALVLRFRLAQTGALPVPGPHFVRALMRDATAQRALQADMLAAEHLFATVLPALEGRLFFEARREIVRSFVIAEARARLATVATLRGTRAELDAAAAPSAEVAFALGVFGGSAAWEAVRRDPRFSDPLSVARTAFDEGVARSEGGARRHRALLEASKASLVRLVTGEHHPFLLPSRLRTLAAIGGPQAVKALEHVLAAASRAASADRRAVLDALVALAPGRALALMLEGEELTGGGRDLVHTLSALEQAAVLPEGTTAGARRALWSLALVRRPEAERLRWLCGFLRALTRELGALPNPGVLALVAGMPHEQVPEAPEALVEELRARRDALLSMPLRELPRALGEEQLALLLALGPRRFGARAPEWGVSCWQRALRRLDREIGDVCSPVIERFRPCLRRGAAATRAMLRGEAPVPALAGPIALDPAGRYHLRYLDKRRDLLAFLRFADVVRCCFHSGSHMYAAGSRLDTQVMVLSLWKDPLSFCFQVQRACAGGVEPFGFVFGSFALRDREPAMLLNGLYLRRHAPGLRFAIVSAIERACCEPLGIRHVAIAARYGGSGALPPGYTSEYFRVHRLRALTGRDGRPETKIYDDLSQRTNMEIQIGYNVYWRTLKDAGEGAGAPA